MDQTGLVLEGGGMRGLYTAGVLEYFMEQDLYFPYVIGVSAGACMAATYLSRQKGRNKKVNVDLVSDPRFLSFRNYIARREIFGMDFLFDLIPNQIVPYDFHTYLEGKEQFVVVATDCHTGKSTYYHKKEVGSDLLTVLRASSSLPFIARTVTYNGSELLDGGLSDPIPVKKAQQDGFKKNVIIMTKEARDRLQRSKWSRVMPVMCRKYPKVAPLLQERYKLYNDTLRYIESEKKKGSLYVLQPSKDIAVKRIEREQSKLLALFDLGYDDAKHHYDQLKEFIEK
ncbi:patatin-like phospholipase family protein [Halalkalibacter lacteus]|uniref:patatin-like phospholipase family protein n=1 Tax=Halalkalibacter lacteus TaxID=3090663 RepID=UPI002FCA93DB